MKRNTINIISVLVLGILCVWAFSPVGFVSGGPGQPHNIWGDPAVAGNDKAGASGVPTTSMITGWIDGVAYGINLTNGTQFDLYVNGDTWGIPSDNAFKDGGYNGDSVMYFLNYLPSSYYFDISDYTSTFQEGGFENVNNLFFDTQTEFDPAYPTGTGTNLRGLKINEVVFEPWNYVYLYDSGGDLDVAALTDPTHGYYLQKDNNGTHTTDGPKCDFSLVPSNVVNWPVGSDYYYVTLNGTFTLNTADELKLVWKNPKNTANNIANGSDVIVDRVEWGNYVNYISPTSPPDDRDYDNTWLVDCVGYPTTGNGFKRTSPGQDTDNCTDDFEITTRSEEAPIGGGPVTAMPGAATNLRVHKGGPTWGGTANDIVLTFNAPTWNYSALKKNIVYYDTNLADGFGWTTYLPLDSTFPGAGNQDKAILPGFLADSNEYAFVVHTTGDLTQGGPNENQTDTNMGYKYNQVLDSTMDWVWISIPYFSDYDLASDITHATDPDAEFKNDQNVSSIFKWNYTTQRYQSRAYIFGVWSGDFDIEPGDGILIYVSTTTSYTWKIVGAHDPTFQFVLDANDFTTDYKVVSLPYHRTYQKASNISDDFGGGGNIVDIIAQYNYTIQNWDTWRYSLAPPAGWKDTNFNIYPSPADAILIKITTTTPTPWQPKVIAI